MAGTTGRETPAQSTRRFDVVSSFGPLQARIGLLSLALVAWPVLLLANAPAPAKPVLEQLEPARHAKVLAAIAGLIILGFGLVLLAWLGARATRRYMNREPVLREKPP